MTTDLEKQLKIETIKCAYCGKERIKSHSDLGKTYRKPCTKDLETAIKYKQELEMEVYGEIREC